MKLSDAGFLSPLPLIPLFPLWGVSSAARKIRTGYFAFPKVSTDFSAYCRLTRRQDFCAKQAISACFPLHPAGRQSLCLKAPDLNGGSETFLGCAYRPNRNTRLSASNLPLQNFSVSNAFPGIKNFCQLFLIGHAVPKPLPAPEEILFL